MDLMPTMFETRVREYSVNEHRATNHSYGDKPYSHHLSHVRDVAERYKHLLLPSEQETAFCVCWTHDLIEDARQTYNDVKQATNHDIAEITYALTTPKGKNRKERNSAEYYWGIKAVNLATFVKLCDRIANVENAVNTGHSMIEAYRKEHDTFVNALFNYQYREMFDYLYDLVQVGYTPHKAD